MAIEWRFASCAQFSKSDPRWTNRLTGSAAYCHRCGRPLVVGADFCASCGARRGGAGISTSIRAAPGETSGKAIASLILGIAGFVVLPVVGPILAIILGVSAKREIASRTGLGGKGMATAGIVLGAIGVAVAALVAFMIILALGTMSHSG
jgi:hypothetical protein